MVGRREGVSVGLCDSYYGCNVSEFNLIEGVSFRIAGNSC